MNLTVDRGNTLTKVALFDDLGHIVETLVVKDLNALTGLPFWVNDAENDNIRCIISSVVPLQSADLDALTDFRYTIFDHTTPIPLVNGYETPETLGLDRLAAAIGATAIKPDTNLLIIDAGSAITYDFVSADGVFRGGNIAPGLAMRLHVLHDRTAQLPLVEISDELPSPPLGRNTVDAIRVGVLQGIIFEIEGYINVLKPDCVFLTGGDAPRLLTFIEQHRPCVICHEPNLVHIGLNQVLNFSWS